MNCIRHIEHNAAYPGRFVCDLPDGQDGYLLLLTHTPAWFWVGDAWICYPAHSLVLYPPNTKIRYRAEGDLFEADRLRFDSDEPQVREFPITGIPFAAMEAQAMHSIFCQMTWETNRSALLTRLLALLDASAAQSRPLEPSAHFRALSELRRAIYDDPQHKWRVAEMAERLHLSEGHLQALYRRAFGVSCGEDVIASRIRAAKSLLRFTDRSVVQIAEFCGYNNAEHFSRQFKRAVGQTPGQYRHVVRETTAAESHSNLP